MYLDLEILDRKTLVALVESFNDQLIDTKAQLDTARNEVSALCDRVESLEEEPASIDCFRDELKNNKFFLGTLARVAHDSHRISVIKIWRAIFQTSIRESKNCVDDLIDRYERGEISP